MKSQMIIGLVLFALLLVLGGSFFVVDETEQAVIMYFGKPERVIAGSLSQERLDALKSFIEKYNRTYNIDIPISKGAGLYFKLPFLQKVAFFEDRLLEYDAESTDIVTQDKKHLLVDNFARWRIVNPLLFLQTLRTQNNAQSRLDDLIYSVLREEMAKSKLVEIVRTSNRLDFHEEITTGREEIMNLVTEKVNKMALEFGIEVLDVRIKRADLPKENEQAVYGRMNAERERISTQYRSEGEEEALKIRAETDRDVEVMLAEAYKEAETIKGEGDAQATTIYAEAYGKDREFYQFLKSLETIEESVDADTRLIIGMEDGIYQFLK